MLGELLQLEIGELRTELAILILVKQSRLSVITAMESGTYYVHGKSIISRYDPDILSEGRQNRGQVNYARGAVAAGNRGAHNRVGNSNPGQAKQIKCYNCNGIRHIVMNDVNTVSRFSKVHDPYAVEQAHFTTTGIKVKTASKSYYCQYKEVTATQVKVSATQELQENILSVYYC
nr:hypothetical protein [Tanacetum cinerariifolium]